MFRPVTVLLSSFSLAALLAAPALALDAVTLGTNWKAQAEHGGFYQALATGLYEAHGLEVTIRPGGPQVNHPQLLAAGRIDFCLAGSMTNAFNYLTADVPMVTVAAIFQKSPLVLMAHPDRGIETPADLAHMPILISTAGRQTFWDWLKITYGLEDGQLRPYTFNAAQFIADPGVAQQGYLTAEPFAVAREGGFAPRVLLLADFGYDSYASMIETSWRLVEENPDLVQRFVDASILGWVSYLHGDPTPGNALIKAANPDMTDAQIAYAIEQMTARGIVESGDALTLGIGAMTDARWRSFLASLAAVGLYPADLDLSRAYTLAFVNRQVGLALGRELTGG
ncbi:MAG: ABC transporter substrate-binding protein [Geminicoccaceae bacterium]|jgi:NitT/TauT family transport system substrate-binding protein